MNSPLSFFKLGRARALLTILLLTFASGILAADTLDPVTLQLKWRHAFQFAGYYAALEKGYYRDAGLDVSIKELSGDKAPLTLMLEGKADYAVTGSDIVIHRAQGEPVVALATIFQHSPYAFLVRADSGLSKMEDFAGKRIMIGTGVQGADLQAALRRAGLTDKDYQRIPTNYDFRGLVRGEIDAFDAYTTDQAQTMDEEGIEGRYILPSSYGVDFYGDVLATSETEIGKHPERVAAFRKASMRGWNYALNHADEMIELILTRYNTQKLSRAHLEYEAITSREMIQPLFVNIGYMNPDRWQQILNIFIDEGFLSRNSSIKGLLYEEAPPQQITWALWIARHVALIAVTLAGMLLLGLMLGLVQARRLVRQRTADLAEKERYLQAIIDTTPLCVKTMDRAGRLLTMNPTGLAMIEADSLEHARNADFTAAVDADYRAQYRNLLHRAFEGESGTLLFSAKSLHGNPLWMETWAVPFRNASGEITNLLAVTRDLTTRKRMELALQEQHDHLQNLLDSINGINWEFDLAADRFTYVSPNASRILGYGIGEWKDLAAWTAMITPEDRERVYHYCTNETAKGRDHLIEYRMAKKNGEVVWVLDLVHVIKDAAGKAIRIAGFIIDQTELKHAEAAVKESEARYRTIFEGAPEGVWLVDENWRTLQVNNRLATLLGYDHEVMTGKPLAIFLADNADLQTLQTAQLIAGTNPRQCEVELRHRDGHKVPVYISLTRLPRGRNGRITTVAFVTDLTTQKLADKALRRAQKMEAVGQLTGGIAHDFNNILGIMLGNLELLDSQLTDAGKARERVDSLMHVTNRAINLTQQLLGFSRQKPDHSTVCNINTLISSLQTLIERSLTPDINVQYRLQPRLWDTFIDAGDFQDSLLNLVINSRDAMPNGGSLQITTSNLTITDRTNAPLPGMTNGDYVSLEISDDGVGISPEHLEHIFEPFFTTKEVGKGTGLGLAMVFGFVQRANGRIDVQSTPGKGTTFLLVFARSRQDAATSLRAGADKIANANGKETILVVDDETALLELARMRLTLLGYQVLTANNGDIALQLLAEHPEINLLFTDVVMPGSLNGYDLAERALALRPELKVLHTSGYADLTSVSGQAERFAANLLHKPYSMEQLSERVRAALGPH
ncbi:MAG TPA: ABC transporter substrate-binding protein [Candidatus Acidoferrum sp.]|nr:ABC transporter substrate-binding protein [Candidatus Acidoferrum sp.]